jgi:membrane-anchored protein YejM (alkaline phosphatase superfamily)
MLREHPFLVRSILLLWVLALVALLIQTLPGSETILVSGFLIITALVWSAILCLPICAIAVITLRFVHLPMVYIVLSLSAVLTSYSLLVFLIANFKLYSLYGFYTNFFVLNLITTPGGIEAMGISASTWKSAIIAGLFGLMAFSFLIRFSPMERLIPTGLKKKHLLAALLFCFTSESFIYIYADYTNFVPVLNSADKVIWYLPITADSMLSDLGTPRTERLEDEFSYSTKTGNLNYFDPGLLVTKNPEHKLNIVWLVAESWRADMITPEIMPNTFAFANEQQWFENHYSGGNGTRMGLFTQFYGLYGHYWFDVLRNRRAPLLIEQLRAQDYQFKAITSSAFTYPEFDKTIFSSLEPEYLQEFNEGHGWERDQKNTGDLISFIEDKEREEQPFFAFMFFESAHANYYFPDEDIIESHYIEDFNYLTVDIEESMPQIKSRYTNATHHLDRQLARVYKVLEEKNLMDNTIVVLTGDHGEEFMENGRWGHNSTFSQQQIRVPMIVHIPGMEKKKRTDSSSHIDMPATILNALGLNMQAGQHSFGQDMFAPDYKHDYLVVSDWHGNTVITPEVKIIFSVKGAAYQASSTTIDDQPINLGDEKSDYQTALSEYLLEQNRFFN